MARSLTAYLKELKMQWEEASAAKTPTDGKAAVTATST